ncbi:MULTISPECIES: histidine phosphatase family protein [unclassified Pantoea]|uniref:histidine phosphatase family protein n=1 Tax=unclassified Pantoea TaxID=2630326 RepID=UPI002579C441|nr:MULTISPECIES: histidine phosphatase family protein [unclassified Pantoea]MDU5473549.1 histidine phosphatase family protein [Pantoea sp.]
MKKWLTILLIITLPGICFAKTRVETVTDEGVNIYLVRHGKTLFNTFDRVQGWADSPLTEEGLRIARFVGQGMKGIRFDRFYVSDAGRHRETIAAILQQAGVSDYQLRELTGLREAFFGGFEGDFNENMAAAAARELGLKDSAALYAGMKSGALPISETVNAIAKADSKGLAENYIQIKERTQSALNAIAESAQKAGDKNVLVVSSGTAMQIMISDLTDNPDKNKPIANGAVIKIISRDGKFQVSEIGTMRYIEAGKKMLSTS